MNNNFIDLVVSGADFSGTSTQIDDIIDYFRNDRKLIVRDIRGTENDALFHSEKFKYWNKDFFSLDNFKKSVHSGHYDKVIVEMYEMLAGQKGYNKLHVSSMVDSSINTDPKSGKRITEYIDPSSADVWIMEEPTYRGAGQVVRTIELYRSFFQSKRDQYSAAMALQAIRTDEFLRFRKPLRDAGKIIVRSRSEESGCYQIGDPEISPDGIRKDDFFGFPGNKTAFANPPTDLFIVCGPDNWNKEEYLKLKSQRVTDRVIDDFEKDADYQLLVNNRYAGNFIEKLYSKGCAEQKSNEPTIHRFDIYRSKSEIKNEMKIKLDKILDLI